MSLILKSNSKLHGVSLLAEMDAYIIRVTDDGGEVHSKSQLQDAFLTKRALNLTDDKILSAVSPLWGVKKNSAGIITKMYSIGGESGDFINKGESTTSTLENLGGLDGLNFTGSRTDNNWSAENVSSTKVDIKSISTLFLAAITNDIHPRYLGNVVAVTERTLVLDDNTYPDYVPLNTIYTTPDEFSLRHISPANRLAINHQRSEAPFSIYFDVDFDEPLLAAINGETVTTTNLGESHYGLLFGEYDVPINCYLGMFRPESTSAKFSGVISQAWYLCNTSSNAIAELESRVNHTAG